MKRFDIFVVLIALTMSVPAVETNILTHADDAAALTAEACPMPRPFDLTGLMLDGTGRVIPFRDATAGIKIENHTPPGTTWQAGDRARIRGELEVSPDDQAFFRVRAVTVLSHGRLPPPEDATAEEIVRGSFDYRFARVRGVVSTVTRDELFLPTGFITLKTPTHSLLVSFSTKKQDYDRLRKLVDAEVEVVGLVQPNSGWRHHLGSHLQIRNSSKLSDIRVLRPPPADPFAAPFFRNARVTHRQRMDGQVAAVCRDRFFLRTARGRFVAVSPVEGTSFPPQGATVSVVGFAEMDPFRLEFREALVRTGGRIDVPPPVSRTTDVQRLFVGTNSAYRINTALRGELITVTVGVREQIRENGRVTSLALVDGPYALFADTSALFARPEDAPSEGSVIRLTGFLLPEFESAGPDRVLPRFRHFTLVPRTAGDLETLDAPPWWTPQRLLSVIIVLVILLVSILLWTRAIHVVSERRGRALYEERLGHALAEQKVEERTRLAVELHDSISQTLTGVSLQLDTAAKASAAGRSPAAWLTAARQMLASCRGELRRCLWDLRSRTFEEKDMTEAVLRTIAPHKANAAVTVRFNVPRERLSESITHAVLRIVRELVVNAIRHGHAKQIRIAGEFHDGTISFSVKDDGCGFDPNSAPGTAEGHFGILGIRERLEDFDGTLEIDSVLGRGTRVSVTLNTAKDCNER